MSALAIPPLVERGGLDLDPGSFRDPGGRVLQKDGRILRIVTDRAAADFRWLRDQGLLETFEREGYIVPTREIPAADLGIRVGRVQHVLEHERVRFVSYPYEWCFAALQEAALCHLDLHLALLERDATLSDASAYNVQFDGARPLFIDILSLRRYHEGELWAGHRQFCEQFLNPLLLQSLCGVPFNAWYRGTMEGIPAAQLAPLLGRRQKASWRVLMHVVAPAKLQRAAERGLLTAERKSSGRVLPKRSLVGLLGSLRRWISRLEPRSPGFGRSSGGWRSYSATHTYRSDEESAKRRFVGEFIAACRPNLLLDLGCNTGDYASLSLEAGAGAVVGLDSDPATVDRAFRRARTERLKLLPLLMDAADPSPARGWREMERRSFSQRAAFDGLIALAFEHHLAIARNIPLDQLVAWVTSLAPQGVIEFVEKEDPTIQRMLALRDDIFNDYSRGTFKGLLQRHVRIVREETITSTGRTLFWYEHDRR
jgi:ribosomal protein L11 methylase PrmA